MSIKLTIEVDPKSVINIGFFIWAAGEYCESIVNEQNRMYFILSDDFSYVIDIFRSVYPLLNPYSKTIEGTFDVCFDIFFDHVTIQSIISKIQTLNFADIEVMNFLEKIIQCLKEKMSIGSYVVIEGNQ
ncbi:hypothetical protein [Acinetobacter gerneri]|jgi:hypothetical protein|uniref:hypothetical protein n=1 Tax=Acinetobacter gerneri TaxID=202952 RepID=UPI0023F2CABE|nr:hypothetical protein [Acinetobacter gerneri]MCH4242992.1 hypothetical protein [Acinetobacter gerneri]